jgi:HK97 gp10 family phage protein
VKKVLKMSEIIKINGLADLERKLKATPDKIRKRLLKRALAKGARKIRDLAKQNAPAGNYRNRKSYNGYVKTPGTLKRAALVKFVSKESNSEQVSYIVTFRKGKKEQAKNRDAYYASWVEFGHKIVSRRSRGSPGSITKRRKASTGRVQGRRFLTNAFTTGKNDALNEITSTMKKDFESTVK